MQIGSITGNKNHKNEIQYLKGNIRTKTIRPLVRIGMKKQDSWHETKHSNSRHLPVPKFTSCLMSDVRCVVWVCVCVGVCVCACLCVSVCVCVCLCVCLMSDVRCVVWVCVCGCGCVCVCVSVCVCVCVCVSPSVSKTHSPQTMLEGVLRWKIVKGNSSDWNELIGYKSFEVENQRNQKNGIYNLRRTSE